MGEMVGNKGAAVSAAPFENPLVPNRKLKRMYEGIVESRMLEDLLRKRHGKAKRPNTRGQEACRISALIDLDPEDLTSDAPASIETAFLRGVTLTNIVKYADATTSGKKKDIAATKLNQPGILPAVDATADRFQLALGAALAIKRLKLPRVVVLFVTGSEVKPSVWKTALRFAAQEELAMLFVALPEPSGGSATQLKPFALSARSTTLGVPGIPVEASDAVALYRVAQESLGRARAGGGPALMECLHFAVGKKKIDPDPIAMMAQTLLNRKVCDEPWLAAVAASFEARLQKLKPIPHGAIV